MGKADSVCCLGKTAVFKEVCEQFLGIVESAYEKPAC